MSHSGKMDHSKSPPPLYFEKQKWRYCGVHAVNHILQKQVFTDVDFDQIAENTKKSTGLSHKGWFGDYDANILAIALSQHGLDIQWIDPRVVETLIQKQSSPTTATASSPNFPSTASTSNDPIGSNAVAIIINRPTSSLLGLWKSRHWVALLPVGTSKHVTKNPDNGEGNEEAQGNGVTESTEEKSTQRLNGGNHRWYLLDSENSGPELIEDIYALIQKWTGDRELHVIKVVKTTAGTTT